MKNQIDVENGASAFARIVSELVTLNDENLAERVMQTNEVQNALLTLDHRLNADRKKSQNEANTVITLGYDSVYEKVYLNVPVLDFLRRGMELLCCVEYDFDRFDAEKIRELVQQPDAASRAFIWLCRSHGTNICSEREAFIRDTGSFKTLVACSTPFVSAYALLVEITGELDGQPIGNIYKLDLAEYVREIQMKTVWQKEHKCTYEDGHTLILPLHSFTPWLRGHGGVVSDEPIPESEAAVKALLNNHQNRRKACVEAALKAEA